MKSPLDILGGRTAELDLSLCTERQGVIYLLIAGGQVVYVGQSTRLVQRIGLHLAGDRRTAVKAFDAVRWFPCAIGDLDDYEGALIRLFCPRYNKRAPSWTGRDNDVLAALGLPLHADEAANEQHWRATSYVARPFSEDAKHHMRRCRATRERAAQHARATRLFAGIEAALLARSAA